MSKTKNTLIFIVVFVPFLCLFGAMGLIMISIGSFGGIVVGILFLLATIISGRFVLKEWNNTIKGIDKQKEIDKHTTFIKTWANSTAVLVEMPNGVTQIQYGALNFCPNLVKLSSLMIKCPKCQHDFPRFYAPSKSFVTEQELFSLRNGGLSAIDILIKRIKSDGFPSAFCCPRCNATIVRSREPSGTCRKTGRRVYGEKLVGCTISQCFD